jgi:hypothetical protein
MRTGRQLLALCWISISGMALAEQAGGGLLRHTGSPDAPVLFAAAPWAVLTVADLGAEIDAATVSDVELADLNGDGRKDICVAWYATDFSQMAANRRVLTVFFDQGTGFARGQDIDLYIPDYDVPARSVFRNGTSEIAVGDFDGDGDLDLAVLPFFGDELWFLENLGDGTFVPHLCFPFGFNSTGNFLTPRRRWRVISMAMVAMI